MDAFDHDGFWWNPREPEKRWTGTLRFNKNGAVLSIMVPTKKPEFFPRLRVYDLILGVTTTGKAVTLFRCFDRNTTATLHEVPRKVEIFANSLIVGFHCDSVEPLISTASVSFSNVDAWWGRSAIEHDQSVKWPDVAVRYTPPAPVVVHDNDGFRVSIRSALSVSREHQTVLLAEDIRVEIQATEPRRLPEFQQIIHACEDLFSIACLTLCGIEDLSLLPAVADGYRKQLGTFHAVPIYTKPEGSLIAPDLLFRFADIKERPEAIFGAWLACAEKLRRTRALYFSSVYGQGFVEGKLLALTQAAEAFHRRFYPSVYMEAEDFEKMVFEPLKDAVPTDIDASFRRAIIDRLRFANEFSFRRRLKALFTEHADALGSVMDEPKKFVDLIVDHRNDFTHHPADLEQADPDADYSERVVRFNYVLGLLLEMCFLKAMGFSSDEISFFARRCETYQKISRRFFRTSPSTAFCS